MLLAVCMVLTTSPGTAFASQGDISVGIGASSTVWENGAAPGASSVVTVTPNFTKVTDDVKCTDSDVGTKIARMAPHAHSDGIPCWAWVNDTGTLTLNNATIEPKEANGNPASRGIVTARPTTIYLVGTNTITVSSKTSASGIDTTDKNLRITGDGSMEITANPDSTSSDGILSQSLTIDGSATVTVSAGRTGLRISYSPTAANLTIGGTASLTLRSADVVSITPLMLSGARVTEASNSETGTPLVTPIDTIYLHNYKYLKLESNNTPTVTGVTVSPATAKVQKGGTQQFTATVAGTNSPAQTVTWAVDGGMNTITETTITEQGLLQIAEDETAETLTIIATPTADTSKRGIATVMVTNLPVKKYTVTVLAKNGTGGGEFEPGATVTVDAGADPDNLRFNEWRTEGIVLADTKQKQVTFTMPANPVKLTSTYVAIPTTSHTITFNPNGGTVATTTAQTDHDGKLASLPTPTKSGSYRFDGWFTAASGGTAVTTATVFGANTSPVLLLPSRRKRGWGELNTKTM